MYYGQSYQSFPWLDKISCKFKGKILLAHKARFNAPSKIRNEAYTKPSRQSHQIFGNWVQQCLALSADAHIMIEAVDQQWKSDLNKTAFYD